MDNQLGLLGHVSCLSMQVGLFSHFSHCQFGIDFARIDFLEINLSRPQHCSEKTLPLGCHPRKNWTYLKNVRIIMPSACVNKMSWDYQWLSTSATNGIAQLSWCTKGRKRYCQRPFNNLPWLDGWYQLSKYGLFIIASPCFTNINIINRMIL
jgi:hypothetical protein